MTCHRCGREGANSFGGSGWALALCWGCYAIVVSAALQKESESKSSGMVLGGKLP